MIEGVVTREKVIQSLTEKKLHPSIPEVVVAIINITRSSSATVTDLVRVIERDPELTSRILSIANSGFYGVERKVRNVSDAVVLMGWNTIKMISLGSTILKMMSEIDMRLYSHSMRVAQIARFLATKANFYKVEEISIVGLLHDLGTIILQVYFREVYLKIKQFALDKAVPIHVAERMLLGVDHAEIGGWTIEEWDMPDNIIESVSLHHAFDPDTYHSKKTAVLHVADVCAIAADWSGPPWEKVPELAPSALKILGITEDDLKSYMITIVKMKFDPLIM